MKIDYNKTYEEPISLDEEGFIDAIENAELPLIVDTWAEWCRPCKAMHPVFEELAKKYAGKAYFVKVNSDEEPNIAQSLGVTGIPTFAWLEKNVMKGRVVGANPQGLEQMVKQAIGE